MASRITTKDTQMWSTAGKRAIVPADTIIPGWQTTDRWVCSEPVYKADGVTVLMKVGWWVSFYDTAEYTPPVDPEPTTDPADFMVHYRVIGGQPVAVERFEKVVE